MSFAGLCLKFIQFHIKRMEKIQRGMHKSVADLYIFTEYLNVTGMVTSMLRSTSK
jgi:hypothetical protein